MKVLSGLPLRQTAGFGESLLRLAGLNWKVPDFSTLCRRQKTLNVAIPYRGGAGPLYLLLIALGVQLAHSCASGQPIKAVALEDTVDAGVGDFDAVIARQIPNNTDWPEVILATRIQNLLNDLGRRLIGGVLRDRFCVLQTSFAMLLVCVTPPIKAGPADAKIPASLTGIADLLGVLEYSKLALNVAFFVRYEYFPHPKSEAACGCVPQLVVAMRTASRRNLSV
jgi:hypothetical protein